MSANSSLPRKLTLDDLDRFLSVPEGVEELRPYCDAAAVLAAFDPFQLRPVGGGVDVESRERALRQLLPVCEPAGQGADGASWTLSLPERREALRRLARRETMKAALESNPTRPDTPLQRMFERALGPDPIDLASLSRDELASLLTVHDWLEDILDGLPDPATVRKTLTRSDLLAPMHRLAGGFVGREQELQQLEAYVFGPKPPAPLFVFGPGGIGKSTLLARFVLDHAASGDVPIGYIDIDRPTIRPDEPLTLLLEAIAQLHPQMDEPAGSAGGLIKEISYAVGRQEAGRAFETAASLPDQWALDMFAQNLTQWLKGRTALLIVDTLEEAQFLGSDVMGPLMDFLLCVERSVAGLQLILSGRTLPEEYMWAAFPDVMNAPRSPEGGPALDLIAEPHRPINLGVLDPAAARELLHGLILAANLAPLDEAELDDVIGIVSRNPMCLKLAARLLRDEGVAKLRDDRTELLTRLRAEKIQALLYGRILRHVHGDDVRKVAYPGLIVRRIDADVIREVLAEPCRLQLDDKHNAQTIAYELGKEAALVEIDPADGSLRHRADVRRAMLEDLTDHVDPSVVESIDRNAVKFYEQRPGDVARAEEIYHRLRLKEPFETLDARWTDAAGQRLKGAVDELPAQQRLWLAERLGVTLDESARHSAGQESWEAQAARSAGRLLQHRSAESALAVLHERPARSPRSTLFSLEAEAYRLLGQPDEALRVTRQGVESAATAGAIDMALELLLKMVVIEEGRGNLEAADTLLKEATAVAAHSANGILQLRVKTTTLRVQRQLRPAERAERAALRREALETLNDEMLHKLRGQPVLLREVAAELAKQDARLASMAIETIGIEVATDAQAQALGKAIATLNPSRDSQSDTNLAEGVEQFRLSDFDPSVIRKWATEVVTNRDTRRLGSTLAEAGDKVLSGFREYFRAGVASTLGGVSKLGPF